MRAIVSQANRTSDVMNCPHVVDSSLLRLNTSLLHTFT